MLNIIGHDTGIAAVEFALVLPILSFMLIGLVSFGSALNNFVDLTEGVRVAARVLAQSSAYPSQGYSNAISFLQNATANLNQSNLNWYVYVNSSSTACNSTTNSSTAADNTACNNALNSAAGDAVTVTATYSLCVSVMGHNFLPGCQLTTTTTQMVE
ncbi:MAG TPA: TadE/TadG family type IV pilus assembly protein [Stellaceae bacterium]|nr:TadE/TadG family type IV pilus assembly protein [Stellaceae bacterium]